jgi:hypothetical protein
MPTQFRVTSPAQLRQEPSRDAQVIAELAPGTIVAREGKKVRRWVPVRHQGQTGWLADRVLEKVEGGAEPDPISIPDGGTDPNRVWTEAEIVQIIREAARAFNQPEEDLLRVARCESVLDPRAVNPQGPWFGLFQFHRSTWASTPFAARDIFDPVANANAAAWMWQQGRRGEWTCQ